MTPASQRMEPGDPRAKAIEAMARAIYKSNGDRSIEQWNACAEDVRDAYRQQAGYVLAALEAEFQRLTDTREAQRLREDLAAMTKARDNRHHKYGQARETIAREALSSVPVEEQSDA